MAVTISAQKRESKGPHSALTELRQKGYVPGVVYGYQTETTPISVLETDLIKTIREAGRNGVIQLQLGESGTNVVLNDYQVDALKGSFEHVDFLAVNMTEELEAQVPVHLTGEAAGATEGGVITQSNHEVTVKARPSDIPATVDIDVTNLAIGDTLTVGDIRGSVPYTITDEDDYVLVSVSAPSSGEEGIADEADEEPPVIEDDENPTAEPTE